MVAQNHEMKDTSKLSLNKFAAQCRLKMCFIFEIIESDYGFGWRHIIAFWAFLAFFVTYMLRVNLNVAIVTMVNQTAIQYISSSTKNTSELQSATCFSGNFSSSDERTPKFVEGKYVWDEKQQGAILAAFFYGYFLTQLPGGILSGMFAKWVFGLGLFLTSFLTLFTSLAAQAGVGFLMGVRFVEGLGEGVLFPAMHHMLGKWVPPLERSKLPAFIYAGYYVGTVSTFAVSGLLAASDWGWPSIFYISGGIGCAWFVGWVILAADSPESHKWISHDECLYITSNIRAENSLMQERIKISEVPWWSIAKSMPVYAVCVSDFCQGFGFYVILIYLPIYLRNILGFDIKENGLISSFPFLMAFFVQIFSSWFADLIRSKHWLSTTNVRKVFDISANFFHGLCLVCLTFIGCKVLVVLMLLTLGTALGALVISGFGVNHIDLAPVYAGVILGISNCIGNITGFLVPTVVGAITENNVKYYVHKNKINKLFKRV